jgi:hypothetical protein
MGAGFEVGHQGITDQAATLTGAGSCRRWGSRFGGVDERIEASRGGLALPYQIMELALPLSRGAEDAHGHAAAQAKTLGFYQSPGCDAIGGKQRFRGENEDEGVTHARLLDGQLVCRDGQDLSVKAASSTSS